MLLRKSVAGEKSKAKIALRKSPRFLQPESLDPKTPSIEPKRNRVLHSGSTPLSSSPKASSKGNRKLCKEEDLKKGNQNNVELKSPMEGNSAVRRSARLRSLMPTKEGLSNASEESNKGDKSVMEISYNVEKRVTRSSSRGKYDESAGNAKNNNGANACSLSKDSKKKVVPHEEKPMVCESVSNKFVLKIEKRVTRNASRQNKNEEQASNSDANECMMCPSYEALDKGAALHEGKGKEGSKLSAASSVQREERNVNRGKKQIGVKRKRNEDGKAYVVVKGWTTEEELALQRAYFTAKPTPHFWKKVARMVPGKSAQECFDKIHSDHLTPPQAQRRSRAKKISPSSLSFSASKLLNLAELKSKKYKYSRCNSRVAQKTVRHLLQKQYNVDQEEERDLFAILEGTDDLSSRTLQQSKLYSTPEDNKGRLSFLRRCQGTPSSGHRKQVSRLSISHGTGLISPPVLKQVKNKALHEKYIGQLHCRDAKRKAAIVRAAKQVNGKREEEQGHKVKLDAVKAAKSALYLDARDAINQFRHLQTTAQDNPDHSDEYDLNSEDEVGEDGS